ncbi:Phosphoglycolate phosphatase [Labrenzia sp. THAF82]|uniref:HAD family hydrolase n=1 Tax=Labrenzia sp. THAF82 TaxID=2587861 RepID=UPI0012A88885|nr:HAD-IA family hydrolase [Labrenzia sp. THAF82]QFT33952.1 Phosphoglycolate phosphatase [Labrenzia sp. THAF82]
MSEATRHTHAVVFDLDGTLVDSAAAITDAVNHIIESHGARCYSVSDVSAFIGDGPERVLERALDGRDLPRMPDDTVRFSKLYQECSVSGSRFFPGIEDALNELRHKGYRLAICTNKPVVATQRLLSRLQIEQLFDAVCCGDECRNRKPHPDHLLETMRRIAPLPKAVVMIGDYRNDLLAANACALPGIFAEWGVTEPTTAPDRNLVDRLHGCRVDARASRPEDLPATLEKLFQTNVATAT